MSEDKNRTVRQTTRVLENPWFAVLRQTVRRPDGRDEVHHTIEFPTPAVGVVVRRDERYLLIRQYRFIVDEDVWGIPAGRVDPQESLRDAAVREMIEETAHEPGTLEPLMGFYASFGSTNQRFEVFLADDARPVAGEPDSNEVLELRWFSRDEIVELLLSDGIPDSLSLAPLLKLCLWETLQSEG
jgi:ADP-ribose pyrophosphatase